LHAKIVAESACCDQESPRDVQNGAMLVDRAHLTGNEPRRQLGDGSRRLPRPGQLQQQLTVRQQLL
jgi:hypothetical protein